MRNRIHPWRGGRPSRRGRPLEPTATTTAVWALCVAFLAAGAVMVAATVLAATAAPTRAAAAPVYGYEFIARYPHDDEAFTQGLIVEEGFFYEGTGLYGESSLRKVELQTGSVVKRIDLASNLFGEGVTALRDTLYQLTYQNHQAFKYVETDSFERIATFSYPWEGWGLTHDGTRLIASDGSSTLRFLDPQTMGMISSVPVHDGPQAVVYLNELEYIGGRVYANIWYSDRIAVIDPASGAVEAWLDLGGLRDSVAYDPGANVLNGIAYEPVQGRLFVTGKWWPEVFEITVPTLPADVNDPVSPAAWLELNCLPNPCRDRTTLVFRSPAEGRVTLAVFDASGRLLRTLVEGPLKAGRHAFAFDASRLRTGIYFVRLTTDEATRTEALRIVR